MADPRAKVRTRHFLDAKRNGIRITGLTSYDTNTAAIFDEAGIDFLLVGDSAGNTVLGYDTTVPVTTEELIPLARAVASSVRRAFVVADLPFGSYEISPEQALATAIRFMKETGAHAVKLEGGRRSANQISRIVEAGIPVMAHIGFTPQSEHRLGGHRVQGRGADAEELLQDALAVEDAGAFAVVLEMVPSEAAKRVTERAHHPDDRRRRRTARRRAADGLDRLRGPHLRPGAAVRQAVRGPPRRADAGRRGLPRRGRLRRLSGPGARVRVTPQPD